jgi:hypothetical protein
MFNSPKTIFATQPNVTKRNRALYLIMHPMPRSQTVAGSFQQFQQQYGGQQ